MQPQTGERVAHYALQARLATGGMGVVYRAFDERTKRAVALKVLSSQFGTDPDYRARFAQESELAASVEHPNIVPIYDVGGYPNLYIAMRLVPGTDLATVLRDGPLPPPRVLDIAESVAGALDEAHRNDLVHRDVKPGNVLLSPTLDRHRSEHVYLTDFGIARSLASERASELPSHRPVVVLGSPAYMAPERLAGEPGGAACDVYGLACVMFECLTGERPWPQKAPPEEINRRQAVDAPHLRSLRPDLPPGLDEALWRAMSRDPRRRPATAGDLAAAARSAFVRPSVTLPDRPVTDRPVPPTAPHQRPAPPSMWSPPPSSPPPAPPFGGPSAPPPPYDPPGPWAPPGVPVPAGATPVPRTTRRARRAQHRQATGRRRRRLLPLILFVVLLAVLGGVAVDRLSGPDATPATRALQARLPSAVYGECSPADTASGEKAALRCDGTDPRVARLEVRQVSSPASLSARFANLSADRGLVSRRCADETGNSGGFWTRAGTRQGAFACYTGSDQQRRVLWQYDASGIEVTAVGQDGSPASAAALYTWWSTEARDQPIAG